MAASTILGIVGAEGFANQRFTNVRQKVFYNFPNGGTSLLGILSLLTEEVTNDPTYKWFEKRSVEMRETTEVNGTTSGPWYADSAGSLGSAMATTAAVRTAGSFYWLRVHTYGKIRIGDIIKITDHPITGGTADIYCQVVDKVTSTDEYLRVTPLVTVAAVTNIYTSSDELEVKVVGNMNSEGQVGSGEGQYITPEEFYNYTQIFRTSWKMTGTAVHTSATYDTSGVYKDMARDKQYEHFTKMEWNMVFGRLSTRTDDDGLTVRSFNGIIAFLEAWEAANSLYRGGTGAAAVTLNTDENKRIINVAGTLTITTYEDYLERLFRVSHSATREKLALCGNLFLLAINRLYEGRTVLTVPSPNEKPFGMDVTTHRTPFGTVHYQTHPLFNENAVMIRNALFLDAQKSLKYRYMAGRDTKLLKNRQENDADYRKDEYLTECGLEVRFPEANMYMQNVLGAA